MNRAHAWLLKNILGIHQQWRSKHERRNSRWRVAGWVLAASPWLVLCALWWGQS